VRNLLATADHKREAARHQRREGITGRDDKAQRRTPPGDVQPSPALHVRQRQEGGPDERRGR